ncbi:MAG: phosphodiester glycosidase family protein [Anaerolineales bacterium]
MSKKSLYLTCLIPILLVVCLGFLCGGRYLWLFARPQPASMTENLFDGVTYTRIVRDSPRPMVIHIVTVNLAEEGVEVMVTPGDPDEELPLEARTTSQFLAEYDLQIAINGDGFTPWYDHSLLNYYPHSGDPVDVIGYAASRGEAYSLDTDNEPTLYISNQNRASLHRSIGKMENAISGNELLLDKGVVRPRPGGDVQPRTAIGVSSNSKKLILVVVDGRQAGYSQGATLEELALILKEHNAFQAINLDGGGSSTLVVEGAFGRSRVLNTPINQGLPGRERQVGNHLGIYASP